MRTSLIQRYKWWKENLWYSDKLLYWLFHYRDFYRFCLRNSLFWKKIKSNIYVLLVPASRQTFLTDEMRTTYIGSKVLKKEPNFGFYSLFETPFGHLPYPLAWKINQSKAAKMNLANRWQKIQYSCSHCGLKVNDFKGVLCDDCNFGVY